MERFDEIRFTDADFQEESDSQVKSNKDLEPGKKSKEKRNRESRFLIVGFLIVRLHRNSAS